MGEEYRDSEMFKSNPQRPLIDHLSVADGKCLYHLLFAICFSPGARGATPATNRAPAAVPPCGDFCFVWEGTAEALKVTLDRAAAKIELGPVPRQGGRRKTGSSVYVRDPDGNLLEFMIYG